MGDDVDPFGRKKDENPLAALGWEGGETASPVRPEPQTEPAPSRERARPAEPGPETWASPPPPREPPVSAASTSAAPAGPAHASPAGQAHEHDGVEALLASEIARTAGAGVGRLVRAVIVIVVVFAVLGAIISTYFRPAQQG